MCACFCKRYSPGSRRRRRAHPVGPGRHRAGHGRADGACLPGRAGRLRWWSPSRPFPWSPSRLPARAPVGRCGWRLPPRCWPRCSWAGRCGRGTTCPLPRSSPHRRPPNQSLGRTPTRKGSGSLFRRVVAEPVEGGVHLRDAGTRGFVAVRHLVGAEDPAAGLEQQREGYAARLPGYRELTRQAGKIAPQLSFTWQPEDGAPLRVLLSAERLAGGRGAFSSTARLLPTPGLWKSRPWCSSPSPCVGRERALSPAPSGLRGF